MPDIELGLAYYAEVVGLVEVAHRRARLPQGMGRAPAPLDRADQGSDLRPRRSDSRSRRPRISTRWRRASRRPASPQSPVTPGELGPARNDPPVPTRAGTSSSLAAWRRSATACRASTRRSAPTAGRHAPAADRPHLPARGRQRLHRLLPRRARLPDDEQILADDGYQLASFLERSHSTHDIAFLSPGRTVVSTTSPSGSTTGTSCATPPTRAPTTASRSTPGRPATARHADAASTSSTPPATATSLHRRLLVRPRRRADHPDRVEIGRAIFYYQGKLNPAFMTTHS